MNKHLAFLPSFGASLVTAAALSAAELGEPAAPLKIDEWIKGKPVELAAGKDRTIFVVEFWATWCPPCRASIPHLTGLQKKFKDQNVVFVGVSDEKVPTVKSFVEKMGDKMDYAVAVDDARKTTGAYMGAYGIGGIPHAFIVDKGGRVVWHGHPMADLEKTLEALVAGKFDIALVQKRARGQKLLEEFVQVVTEGKDESRAGRMAKELEALDKEVGGLMPEGKFDPAALRKMIKFQSAMGAYEQAVSEGKDDAEVARLAQAAEAAAPTEVNFADLKQRLQTQALFQRYLQAATSEGQEARAGELAAKLGAVESRNADMLNEMAWVLLTDEKIRQRNLPAALKLAKAAHDASQGRDPAILDTYARALFDSGKVAEAVTVQKKAVELARNDLDLRDQLDASLKKYQEKAGAK